MMFERVQIILASLALLLGIAHIIYGLITYETFNLELYWFLSCGAAIIITALANFRPDTSWILKAQNTLMLGFIILLLSLIQGPHIWLGCILFSGLLALSFFNKGGTKRATPPK